MFMTCFPRLVNPAQIYGKHPTREWVVATAVLPRSRAAHPKRFVPVPGVRLPAGVPARACASRLSCSPPPTRSTHTPPPVRARHTRHTWGARTDRPPPMPPPCRWSPSRSPSRAAGWRRTPPGRGRRRGSGAAGVCPRGRGRPTRWRRWPAATCWRWTPRGMRSASCCRRTPQVSSVPDGGSRSMVALFSPKPQELRRQILHVSFFIFFCAFVQRYAFLVSRVRVHAFEMLVARCPPCADVHNFADVNPGRSS